MEDRKDRPLTPPETQPDIKQFSPEARCILEKKGYHIYSLTGQSIESLRAGGRPFLEMLYGQLYELYPQLETMRSRLSEVAINPDYLLLPNSNRKTLTQQEDMVEEFSEELNIPGAKAIIGELPDYVELVIRHHGATLGILFEHKTNDSKYTRTKTPTGWRHGVACVGNCITDLYFGLSFDDIEDDQTDDTVFVAPIIVPEAA